MNWNYTQPVAVRFGNGRLNELPQVIQGLGGTRGLLVTSPSFEKRGVVTHLQTTCPGLFAAVYASVSPNPDVKECEACIQLIRQNQCDFVVALGGGSVMDCAKAAASFSTAENPVSYYMDGGAVPEHSLPLIAVPTTAGTGSEITCVAVLSDHQRGLKLPLSGNNLYPTAAIIDPELTYSVPQHTTACTGMDVLCHALEAYWSRYHLPVCDALAVHALKLVFTYLPAVCKEPNNAFAREKMAEASVIAGMAFTVPKTTSAHACSYPLTNLLGIAHGEACALTIDHFLRINLEMETDGRIAELAKLLGFESGAAMADSITDLKREIGMMPDLKQYHLTDEQLEALVQGSKHPNLLNNPVKITEEMLRDLYEGLR